jgi:hypothetical protein
MTGTVETAATTAAVYLRRSLAAPWTLDAQMVPTRVSFALAPEVSTAELVRHYGLIEDTASPTEAGPELVAPATVSDYHVKIVLTRGTDTHTWYGLITSRQDHPGKPYAADYPIAAGRSKPMGYQTFRCHGWEYLLTRHSIQEAVLAAKTGWAKGGIYAPLVFNSRSRQGKLAGNRSATKDTTDGCYLFSDASDRTTWTALDVLEYLLALFDRDFSVKFALGDPVGALDGLESQHDALATYADVWDLHGLTFADAIMRLASPARGFAWFCQGDQPTLTVVSTVSSPVMDGATVAIPDNPRTIAGDLDTSEVVTAPVIRAVDDAYYHSVSVYGDLLRVCFTAGFSTGHHAAFDGFEKNWLTALETTYAALDDDDAMMAQAYDHLYCSYKLADAWDGLTGAIRVLIHAGFNGTIDPDSLATNWHRRSLVLDRTIPYLQADGTERAPLVLAWSADDAAYFRVDRPDPLELQPAHVRILDNELGIALSARYPHQYGLNTFAGANSDRDAEIDYRQVLATVALHTQERVQFALDTDRPLLPDEQPQDKVISVPGLGIDYAVEGTVTDWTGGDTLTRVAAGGEYLRNDHDTLARIAAIAAAWYGRRRFQIEAEYSVARLLPYLGYLLTNVSYNGSTLTAGTIISRITYKFAGDRQAVHFATNFTDVDWGAMFAARGATAERQRLDAVEDAVRRVPVAPALGGSGASAYDGPFAVSQDPDAAAGVIVGADRATNGGDKVLLPPAIVAVASHQHVTITATGWVYTAITREWAVAAAAPAFAAAIPADTATVVYVPLAYVTFAAGAVTGIYQKQYGNIILDQIIIAACPT